MPQIVFAIVLFLALHVLGTLILRADPFGFNRPAIAEGPWRVQTIVRDEDGNGLMWGVFHNDRLVPLISLNDKVCADRIVGADPFGFNRPAIAEGPWRVQTIVRDEDGNGLMWGVFHNDRLVPLISSNDKVCADRIVGADPFGFNRPAIAEGPWRVQTIVRDEDGNGLMWCVFHNDRLVPLISSNDKVCADRVVEYLNRQGAPADYLSDELSAEQYNQRFELLCDIGSGQ